MKNRFEQVMDQTHKQLKQEFANDEDVIIAQELENFLNAVVYGDSNVWNASDGAAIDDIKSLLTQELFNELRTNTSLMYEFTNTATSGMGQRGEEAFATAIMSIIEKGLVSLEDSAAALLVDGKLNKNLIISGASQSTVPLSQAVGELLLKHTGNLKVTGNDNEFYRTYFRQQKNDIDTSILEGIAEWTPAAQKLIGLTASVKNYRSFLVKLEQLNVQKAYLAVTSQVKDISEKDALDLFNQYYITKKLKPNPKVTAHLNHLAAIYALTGYGQYVHNIQSELILAQYSRFLMYNNPAARVIKIKSTKEIVSKLIDDPATASNFHIGHSGRVKYYMSH